MRTLGNILWFLFGGLIGGLAWTLADPVHHDYRHTVWITVFYSPRWHFFRLAKMSYMAEAAFPFLLTSFG